MGLRKVLWVLLLLVSFSVAFAQIELKFYYPVGVAGPLARVIDYMCEQFNKENPDVKVIPVYSGNYDDTMQKILTSVMAKNPPDIAVIEISEIYTLVQLDAIIPLDDYIKREGPGFLDQFWPAFLANSYVNGKIWAFPFQRSTPVLYWNKELFRKKAKELQEAGLDPNRAPRTWYELVEYARILTERKGNETVVYGLMIPGGWNDWLFEAFVRQNGSFLLDYEQGKVNFDSLEALQALTLWDKLINELKVCPPLRPWETAVTDFVAGKVAMLYYSTGGLAAVRNSAKFEFDVAFLPMHVQYGTPVGGGNFVIFKGIPKEKQDAAWRFIKWMTSPKWAAYWSRESGYVCVNKLGYELPEMKKFMDEFPQMWVAARQLEYAYPKMMAPNYQQIRKIMTTNLDAVQQGKKSPKDALRDMQRQIEAIVRQAKQAK